MQPNIGTNIIDPNNGIKYGLNFMSGNPSRKEFANDVDPPKEEVILPENTQLGTSKNEQPIMDFENPINKEEEKNEEKNEEIELKFEPINLANSAATMLGSGLAAYGAISSIDITSLTNELLSKSTDAIVKSSTQMFADYIANHAMAATKFPGDVSSYAMSYFNEHKLSASDIIKSIMTSAEAKEKELTEGNQKKNTSDFLKNVSEKAKKYSNTINDFVSKASPIIETAISYIDSAGVDWVVEQVNKQSEKLLQGVKKGVNDQWEKDKQEYQNQIISFGETIGQGMVKEYNKRLERVQQKAQQKIENAKSKSLIKILEAKAKAASVLGSKLGIYIPI